MTNKIAKNFAQATAEAFIRAITEMGFSGEEKDKWLSRYSTILQEELAKTLKNAD